MCCGPMRGEGLDKGAIGVVEGLKGRVSQDVVAQEERVTGAGQAFV